MLSVLAMLTSGVCENHSIASSHFWQKKSFFMYRLILMPGLKN